MRSDLLLSTALQAALLSCAHASPGFVSGDRFGLAGTNVTYDYVVVGGGTAGLTMAYRLSQDPTKTVAVIEAGGFASVYRRPILTISPPC